MDTLIYLNWKKGFYSWMRIIWFWHFQRTGFRLGALGVCQCSSESGSFVFCPCIRSLQYGVQYWFPAENCQLWSSLCLVREEEKSREDIESLEHTIRKVNFCPKIQFWQKPNIFTSFSTKFLLTIFLVKSKLSTAKKSKTTTFSRVFHPKKSIIFSGNQTSIFGQKMKISNSVSQ